MDHRVARSPSPALSIGRDGKPQAHMKHSRPSSRSSSRASSRPSSRGSPYAQIQNPLLLSALHQGPSQQPAQYPGGLALPAVPAMSLQHRISPLPLTGLHHGPAGTLPIFQGSGLVNILPPSSAMTPAGSVSPELLAVRPGSASNSLSPGSQSSVSPLTALRQSPINPQLAELLRLAPESFPNHRPDINSIAEHYKRLEMASQRAEQGYKPEISFAAHTFGSEALRQQSASMPPPPSRDPRQDFVYREQIDPVRSREAQIKREREQIEQTRIDGKSGGYPATGALAQLMKMNTNQATRLPVQNDVKIEVIDRAALPVSHAARFMVSSGKPRAQSQHSPQSRGGASNSVQNVTVRDQMANSSLGFSAAQPRSLVTMNAQPAPPPVSVISMSMSEASNPRLNASQQYPSSSSHTQPTAAHPAYQIHAQQHHFITTTTTVHTNPVACYTEANNYTTAGANSSHKNQHRLPIPQQQTHLKPIIAQKPSSVPTQASSVNIVRIPSTLNPSSSTPQNGQITAQLSQSDASKHVQKVEQPFVRQFKVETVQQPKRDQHLLPIRHSPSPGKVIRSELSVNEIERLSSKVQHIGNAQLLTVGASHLKKSGKVIKTMAERALANGGLHLNHSEVSTQEFKEVERPNPLNKRVQTLCNFPSSQQNARVTYRSHAMAVHRAKAGSITNAAKSLDLLRQNLQKYINKEIDQVVQKYVETYFRPALGNIRENGGEESPSLDEYLNNICAQLLEEAKRQYCSDIGSVTTEITDNVSEAGSISSRPSSRTTLVENKDIRAIKHSLFNIKKRRGSSDSDASMSRKRAKKPKNWSALSGRSTPSKKQPADLVRKDGPKWDPERLTEGINFVMGSKANK